MDFTPPYRTRCHLRGCHPTSQGCPQEQGFGVLTEIDVRKTLKENSTLTSGADHSRCLVSPKLAHRAWKVDPSIATLLP